MAKNYFDLSGEVAMISGASSGLGIQLSRALASQGAKVVLLARREELLKKVAEDIEKDFGVETLPLRCDATSTEDVDQVVAATIERFGRIDILVNCAGLGHLGNAEDIKDEDFLREIEVDLFGTFRFARAVAKEAMIPAKYGRIINISSMYGLVGNKIAPAAPYHAAKGGTVNLTRALAAEWGKYGITVNTIAPGYFWTAMTQSTLETEQFAEYARGVIPVERYGKEGELDTAILFLSSRASSYVTGIVLPVDGGFTAM